MIKYTLRCRKGHEFESWFQSSAAYDKLAKRGQVSCAVCGADGVEKAMMAPRISKRARASKVADATVPQPLPPALGGEGKDARRSAQLAMMRAIRADVATNAEYVGPRFATEARRIHEAGRATDEDAPSPKRRIYGEASPAEARELIEDGITVLPLPRLPEDHN